MYAWKWIAGSLAGSALAAASATFALAEDSPARAPEGPRVVMLGFDGGSFDLARRFIDEGRMPWCAKLEKSGTFLPLGSANPAESPVAWASINTGMNPGKTNIFGFIRRTFRYFGGADGPPKQVVMPTIGYSRDHEIEQGGVKLPSHKNDLSCPNFWDRLDAAGLPSRILQAACNFPAEAGANTKLLAGLSVPDVRGGPGTYLVYTNSEWEFNRGTGNGGEVIKFRVVCPKCQNKSFSFKKGCSKCNGGRKPEELAAADRIGWFETRLEGPENFVEIAKWDARLADLQKKYDAAANGSAEKQQAQKDLNAAKNERKNWEKENQRAAVAIRGTIDRAAGTVEFELAGRKVTLREGEWADYIPVTFEVAGAFPVKATAHLHLSQCNEKADDVRFYLPAVTAAADAQPPHMPITSPPDFGRELVESVGLFDTIGWSCQTHALKDDELTEPSFLSAIWDTIQWRRRMLLAQLEKPDWRTLFQVFGETDRVCHMMYRFFDEKHPQFKPEEAAKTARFGDREISYRDAIPAVYEEVDKTIGLVMERLETGALGDCTLLVCSDHGFSPFREEVEINAWLIENGFMGLKEGPDGRPTSDKSFLSYVDWSKTKAYSIGIGTIYLNLKGREQEGIVDPADYDKVCDELIAKMRAYRNPNPASTNDPQVFADAWKRSQYLSGEYAADIRGDVTVNKGSPFSFVVQDVCVEGAADIQVGFNYGYRVGWGTAMGDRATKEAVFPNKNRWSGDHTSVHPYLVRGIFLSNRRTAAGTQPHLQDLAPTILAIHGVAVPADMDGRVLPLAKDSPMFAESVLAHRGGTANRESLTPPPGR